MSFFEVRQILLPNRFWTHALSFIRHRANIVSEYSADGQMEKAKCDEEERNGNDRDETETQNGNFRPWSKPQSTKHIPSFLTRWWLSIKL